MSHVPSVSLSSVRGTVDFNSANSDNAFIIALPPRFTRWVLRQAIISGANHDLSMATCGVFTAAAAGGTALVTSGTAITLTATAAATLNNIQYLSMTAAAQATSFTATTIYFRVQNAEGAPATADVTLVYDLLP